VVPAQLGEYSSVDLMLSTCLKIEHNHVIYACIDMRSECLTVNSLHVHSQFKTYLHPQGTCVELVPQCIGLSEMHYTNEESKQGTASDHLPMSAVVAFAFWFSSSSSCGGGGEGGGAGVLEAFLL